MGKAALRSKVWRLVVESGLGFGIIGAITILRLLGVLQFLELVMLDKFQQLSPAEPADPRIVLIDIDESNSTNENSTSIKYADLAELVETVLSYGPAVVAIDLVEADLSGDGKPRLLDLFEANNNLITVEKIRPPEIAPLSEISDTVFGNQVGFHDFSLDNDGNVRRMFLGWTKKPGEPNTFRKSFALMIAEKYLSSVQNIGIENGVKDRGAMRFGDTEIPRLSPFSGGYRREQSIYGIQTLINFRGGLVATGENQEPFTLLPPSKLLEGRFGKEDPLFEKIVIIGSLKYSKATQFKSGAFVQIIDNRESLTGLELQAHAVSQITSAAVEGRPLIWVFSVLWEYVLIVVFGLIGVIAKRTTTSTLSRLIFLLSASSLLTLISYGCFVFGGLWLPFVPAILALVINGFIYITVAQSSSRWRSLVQERDLALAAVRLERQKTIEHAFDAIHNGPLQTLANLLRQVRDDRMTAQEIANELSNLNCEIREVGESLRQGALSDETLYIQVGSARLDLETPLHELFYEIYRETLERSFPGFQKLKIQARSFEPIEPDCLDFDCKHKLCSFFEEALCNVGRHAIGATELTVTGKRIEKFYCLRVVDNGMGLRSHQKSKGRGTKIAYELESALQGKFIRRNNYPKGVICELKWILL